MVGVGIHNSFTRSWLKLNGSHFFLCTSSKSSAQQEIRDNYHNLFTIIYACFRNIQTVTEIHTKFLDRLPSQLSYPIICMNVTEPHRKLRGLLRQSLEFSYSICFIIT
jgi:hypothetical protein